MGRSPRCTKEEGIKRGAWTAAEDKILTDYIAAHGEGKWRSIPKQTGLKRCGKSCRLRWLNYLRPDIKRGNITLDEEDLIIRLHRLLGNRWSLIAGRLPGRTDNEIKNYWNSYLSKQVRRDHKDERHNTLNKHKNANMEPKISTSGPKSEENHQLMMPSPATAVLPPQPPLPLPDDPILHLDFAMNAENLPAMDYESANVSTSPTLSGEDLSPDIAMGLPNFFEPDFSSFYEFGFTQFDLELEGDWSSLQCIEEADISHSGSLECYTAFSYAPDQWII